MESSEGDNMGGFGLRILSFGIRNSIVDSDLYWYNNNVPIDHVIMQLKAALKQLEKGYFNKFDERYDLS